MARNTQPIAQPVPTLTPEALRQIINEVLAEREKKTRTDDLEALTVRAFRRAGYDEHENPVRTSRRVAFGSKRTAWSNPGRRPSRSNP